MAHVPTFMLTDPTIGEEDYEPWFVVDREYADGFVASAWSELDVEGDRSLAVIVVSVLPRNIWDDEKLDAAKARIVACVNALSGISTEAIEAGAVQRLRSALEKCLNFITNTESELGETLDCGDAARTALSQLAEARK